MTNKKEKQESINVELKTDRYPEPDETYSVNLENFNEKYEEIKDEMEFSADADFEALAELTLEDFERLSEDEEEAEEVEELEF